MRSEEFCSWLLTSACGAQSNIWRLCLCPHRALRPTTERHQPLASSTPTGRSHQARCTLTSRLQSAVSRGQWRMPPRSWAAAVGSARRQSCCEADRGGTGCDLTGSGAILIRGAIQRWTGDGCGRTAAYGHLRVDVGALLGAAAAVNAAVNAAVSAAVNAAVSAAVNAAVNAPHGFPHRLPLPACHPLAMTTACCWGHVRRSERRAQTRRLHGRAYSKMTPHPLTRGRADATTPAASTGAPYPRRAAPREQTTRRSSQTTPGFGSSCGSGGIWWDPHPDSGRSLRRPVARIVGSWAPAGGIRGSWIPSGGDLRSLRNARA